MRSARYRLVIASLAAGVGAACAGAPPPAPFQSPQTAGGTLEIGPAVPTLAPGDLRVLGAMTDRDIVGHMDTVDSLEAVIAGAARTRATAIGVRRFAGQLVADHMRSLVIDDSLARTPSIVFDQSRRDSAGPLVNVNIDHAAGDTVGIALLHVFRALQALPAGAQFDRAFVSAQIATHQRALAELRYLQNVARKGAVREHIGAEIPVLEQHLIAAQQLAAALGP
ncbi:MAG TPA: DUF4142 domain-containing protein [Gemmatimonadaceae bacterium]|nr:DUF4142 domain-containing protein [Gemmatimonadaceae bacterium]